MVELINNILLIILTSDANTHFHGNHCHALSIGSLKQTCPQVTSDNFLPDDVGVKFQLNLTPTDLKL